MEIEFTNYPDTTDLDLLTQKINQESESFGAAYPFSFFIRDEAKNIIAGCNGSVIFGCIYTDQLWVDINYRKKGLGKQLINAVHEYGKKSGCSMATVNTMSFQNGKTFYEKLGSISFSLKINHTHILNQSCKKLKTSRIKRLICKSLLSALIKLYHR